MGTNGAEEFVCFKSTDEPESCMNKMEKWKKSLETFYSDADDTYAIEFRDVRWYFRHGRQSTTTEKMIQIMYVRGTQILAIIQTHFPKTGRSEPAEIDCLQVLEPRQGYGSKLLAECERVLREENFTTVFLTSDSDERAKDFYRKNLYTENESDGLFYKKL